MHAPATTTPTGFIFAAMLLVSVAVGFGAVFGSPDVVLAIAGFGPLLVALLALAMMHRPRAPATGPLDPLTGLPGRAGLARQISARLAAPGQSERTAAAIVVDLDDFHAFNDRWGRAAADRLLQTCADRLRAVIRPDDLLGRLDADAFALFLAPSDRLDMDAVLAVTERLQRALAEPVRIDGASAYCSGSAGVALRRDIKAPTDRMGEAILAAAERAMTEARAGGSGAYQVYSPKLHALARDTHDLAEDVARALDAGEVTAWLQPQVSADGQRVTGVEALARWQHPKLGPVSPAQFLPAIAAAGRSERLSEVMLTCALRCLSDWDASGVHVPKVGVNFGALELRAPRLVDKVRWELDRFQLTPDRLAVEVLETVVSQGDDDILLKNLAQLRDLGCRIELDDFGTGTASIAAIRRFGVSQIKIDRSFVSRLDRDPAQASLCGAIITMAKELQVDVLAEGVETLGEQSALAAMGCGQVQGFGIARPMPPPDALAWLIDHQHRMAEKLLGASNPTHRATTMPPVRTEAPAPGTTPSGASAAHALAKDPEPPAFVRSGRPKLH